MAIEFIFEKGNRVLSIILLTLTTTPPPTGGISEKFVDFSPVNAGNVIYV
jgi:hypothetical protein